MKATKSLKLVMLLAGLSAACGSNTIEVSGAWVRATAPGQEVAAAYMTIRSPVETALIAATSEVAEAIEIHSMSMENGMMRMRKLDKLSLPARKAFALEPAGYHLMLLNLRRSLNQGQTIPLVLIFERDGETQVKVETTAQVRGRAD